MESQQTLVISRGVFGNDLEIKDRSYFSRTNTSSSVSFIPPLPLDSGLEFRATPEDKPSIIGTDNTIPMSGAQYVSAEYDPALYLSQAKLSQLFGGHVT